MEKLNYKKLLLDDEIIKNIHLNNGLSYRVKELLNNFEIDTNIQLSNKLFLQRDYVWNNFQQQSLILSLFKEIYIPPLICVMKYEENNLDKKNILLIDGKQRFLTILKFISNEFSIFFENKKYFYSDFDDESRKKFLNKWLLMDIYYEYDIPLTDEQLIYIFWKINFQGTQQEVEHLNKLKNGINLLK